MNINNIGFKMSVAENCADNAMNFLTRQNDRPNFFPFVMKSGGELFGEEKCLEVPFGIYQYNHPDRILPMGIMRLLLADDKGLVGIINSKEDINDSVLSEFEKRSKDLDVGSLDLTGALIIAIRNNRNSVLNAQIVFENQGLGDSNEYGYLRYLTDTLFEKGVPQEWSEESLATLSNFNALILGKLVARQQSAIVS